MSFFFIPFGIFLGSVLVSFWIIKRKFTYLKKLTPDSIESATPPDSFFAELYPEIASRINKTNLRTWGLNILNEFEKLLRRLRLISLRIDTFTNRLIHRVRKESKQQEEILVKEAKIVEDKIAEADVIEIDELGDKDEDLKQKEQLLIIEIAKNPKDAQLYKELGTVYMRMGDWLDAKQSFEKSIDLEPENEEVKRKLGRVIGKINSNK